MEASCTSSAVITSQRSSTVKLHHCVLTHVYRAVVADEDCNNADHANERCQTDIRPSSGSGKCQDRVFDIASWGHDPEWDDDSEKTCEMKDQEDAFNHG